MSYADMDLDDATGGASGAGGAPASSAAGAGIAIGGLAEPDDSAATATEEEEERTADAAVVAVKVARTRLTMEHVVAFCVYRDLGRLSAVCVAYRDGVRRAPVALLEDSIATYDIKGPRIGAFWRSFPCAVAMGTRGAGSNDSHMGALVGKVSLRRLSLAHSHISDAGIIPLFTGATPLTNLTSLDLRHNDTSEVVLPCVGALPKLTELGVSTSTLGHGGADVLGRMTHLRALKVHADVPHLQPCRRPASAGTGPCADPVRDLGLPEPRLCVCCLGPSMEDAVSMLAPHTSLVELDMVGFWFLVGPIVTTIGTLTALTSLQLQQMESPPELLPDVADLAGLTRLRRLSLNSCGWVTDAGVEAGLHDMAQLEDLDLYGSKMLTDAGVASFLGRTPALRRVNLAGTSITPATLELLYRCCPDLEWLGLDHVHQLSSDWVARSQELVALYEKGQGRALQVEWRYK